MAAQGGEFRVQEKCWEALERTTEQPGDNKPKLVDLLALSGKPDSPRGPPGAWQQDAPVTHVESTTCSTSFEAPEGGQVDSSRNSTTDPNEVDGMSVPTRLSLRTLADEAEQRGTLLASVGAVRHEEGKCIPCLFWFRGLCTKDYDCTYCHMVHQGQTAKKIRPSKRTRDMWKTQGDAAQDMKEKILQRLQDAKGCGVEDSAEIDPAQAEFWLLQTEKDLIQWRNYHDRVKRASAQGPLQAKQGKSQAGKQKQQQQQQQTQQTQQRLQQQTQLRLQPHMQQQQLQQQMPFQCQPHELGQGSPYPEDRATQGWSWRQQEQNASPWNVDTFDVGAYSVRRPEESFQSLGNSEYRPCVVDEPIKVSTSSLPANTYMSF